MADRTVSIRLSLQDHEKVRTALESLGPTGQKALQRIEQASEPASRALRGVESASLAVQGGIQQLAGRAGPLGAVLGALGPAGLLAAAGIGGIAAAVAKAIPAYTQFEQQTFRLEALLKSTGNSAGLTIQQIEELAQRIGRDTLASTQGVRDAAGVLLTFKSVSGDTFVRTIELAQDLSAVLGNELRGNVLQLGKALEDPVQGVSALREAGVSFTESQKDLIKSLVETGRTAEAQTIVLNTLAEQVGGAGVGEAGGLAGAADTAGEKWKLFYERLGATAPVFAASRALQGLNDAAASFLLGTVTRTPATEIEDAVAAVEAARNNLESARSTPIFGDVGAAERQLELAELALVAARERAQMAEVTRAAEEAAAREAAADAARARDRERTAAADREKADKAAEASAKLRAEIEAKARAADLAHRESITDFYQGVPAAIEENAKREAQARKKAAEDAAKAREKAEEKAQAAIDRAREEAYREAVRNTENLADSLVDAGRGFLDALFDDSRDFWQNFADLARSTLLDIAAEQLFRAPANAFAAGLFGTGGATGGANAGGIAGLAGSLGRSVASSAIADAIGLPSIGSLLGFGGGGTAAAAGSVGAFGGASATAVEAAVAASSAGAAGGAGFLAAAAPFALPAAALAGAYLLSGGLDRPSVGPNASARLTLEGGRFVLGATGADNGGRQFLNQAESEALAAADVLNRIITELGLTVDDVPDAVDLATAFGDQFNRTGRNVLEDVIRSGALGELTPEQLEAALAGESVLGAPLEIARQALNGLDVGGTIRDAQRVAERAAQEAAADQQRLLDAEIDSRERLVDALRDVAEDFRDLAEELAEGVDDLLISDLRGLSPDRRLAEVQRQFDAAVAGGDPGRALGLSSDLLGAANAYFGAGSVDATAVFERTVDALLGLEAEARRGEDEAADRMLEALARLEAAQARDSAAEVTALREVREGVLAQIDELSAARVQARSAEGVLREQLTELEAAGLAETDAAASLREQIGQLAALQSSTVEAEAALRDRLDALSLRELDALADVQHHLAAAEAAAAGQATAEVTAELGRSREGTLAALHEQIAAADVAAERIAASASSAGTEALLAKIGGVQIDVRDAIRAQAAALAGIDLPGALSTAAANDNVALAAALQDQTEWLVKLGRSDFDLASRANDLLAQILDVNQRQLSAMGSLAGAARPTGEWPWRPKAGADTDAGIDGYAGGTGSAVPGWAWVGERGPELVRFRGGERVMTAPASRAASTDSVALLAEVRDLLQVTLRLAAEAGNRQVAGLARVGDELEQLGGPLRRLAAER